MADMDYCQFEIEMEQDEKSEWKYEVRMYAKQHGYTLFESLEEKGTPVMKHVEWDDVRAQRMTARNEENNRQQMLN